MGPKILLEIKFENSQQKKTDAIQDNLQVREEKSKYSQKFSTYGLKH